ncbi:MAG: hypothetical protein KGH94_03660 [Candidatus Micrarchaeota archaeon]|nr:hypothetical protein [Candidatus Micrarchaeota archaeon]
MGARSVYPRYGTVTVNYTASSTGGCALTPLSGTFRVINESTNKVVYSAGVTIPRTGSQTYTSNITFPTSNMTNTIYIANVMFSAGGFSTSGSNTFALVNYADVVIESFSAPSTATVGSTMSFTISLQNTGDTASGPIALNFSISGPRSYNSLLTLSALSPGQESNTVIILNNVTGVVGTYVALAAITYNSYGSTQSSTSSSLSYTVSQPVSSGPQPVINPPSSGGTLPPLLQIPQVNFTYMPLLVSGGRNSTTLSQIGFRNSGNLTEVINLTVDPAYSSLLSLSTDTVNLGPNESVSVQAYFTPGANLPTGVYSIPIYVTARYQGGGTASGTGYLTFSVYSQGGSQPIVASQVALTNNGTVLSGIISIIAPNNQGLRNATLVQWLPLSIAKNISDISVYGLSSNIVIENNSYKISSKIGRLPRSQTIYEYYSIKGPSNPSSLLRSRYAIETLSPESPQEVLRLAGISAPAIVGNTVGTITASVLYTGTSPSNVTFLLVPSPQITVQNETQKALAFPNQLITKQFTITNHPKNGTYILQLYISAAGANLTYGVPVVINPVQPSNPSSGLPYLPLYVRIGVFIVLIIAVIALFKGRAIRQRYSPDRAGTLIRMREQIKRES